MITLSTPVSVRVGSDQYKARIVKITDKRITVERGPAWAPTMETFRLVTFPGQQVMNEAGDWVPCKGWVSGPRNCRVFLVIGESATVLDPSF